MLRQILFVFSLALISTSAISQVCVSCNEAEPAKQWEGDVDADWNNPLNWSGNTLPTSGTNIGVDGDIYTIAPVISATSSFTPNDVFVEDNATLIIQVDFDFNDDLVVRNNSIVTFEGGATASGDDTSICNGGTLFLSSGNFDNTSGSGQLRICLSEPVGATGSTEVVIDAGDLITSSTILESGTLGDVVRFTGGGTGSFTDDNGTLPVELVAFVARPQLGYVQLTWETATEVDNDFFEVQRSIDGANFQVIGMVQGNGSSDENISYFFEDRQPAGQNYYRLRQVDFNGDFEFSPVVFVEYRLENKRFVVSYNPDGTMPLSISADSPIAEMVILDQSGQPSFKATDFQQLEVPVQQWKNGIYFVHLTWKDHRSTQKVLLMR